MADETDDYQLPKNSFLAPRLLDGAGKLGGSELKEPGRDGFLTYLSLIEDALDLEFNATEC